MARFKIDDRVRILSTVATSFAGLDGLICEVKSNDRGLVMLDQYDVSFSWGEHQTFYDVQLQLSAERSGKRVAA